jgi:hypothetical protein
MTYCRLDLLEAEYRKARSEFESIVETFRKKCNQSRAWWSLMYRCAKRLSFSESFVNLNGSKAINHAFEPFLLHCGKEFLNAMPPNDRPRAPDHPAEAER